MERAGHHRAWQCWAHPVHRLADGGLARLRRHRHARGSGNRYYDGPSIFAGDTHNTKLVVGQHSTNPGDWVCESGAISGVLCGIHVLGTDFTQWFNGNSYKIDGLVIAPDSSSSQPQGGDSGGPVFSLAGTGTVTAKGTVTGGGGGYFYYTPMDVISNDLGVSVNTG